MARTAAVVFDLFGTLVPPVDRRTYRAAVDSVAGALEVDADALAELWMHDEPFREMLMTAGSSTLAQMDSTCERLGVSRSPAVRRRAAEIHLGSHRDWMQPWADSLATLHQLRTKGVRLGLISDCSISVPELWPQSSFATLFDCALFSCVEGATKPAQSLFAAMCVRLGVRAADCVYVGDRFDELRGASEAGMRAVWLGVPGAESSIQWSGPRITRPGEVCAFVSASATAASMRQ